MKRILFPAILALAPVLAQAQAPTAKPVVIKPTKTYEKCLQLDAGQKLEYRFESAPNSLQPHYQKGPEEVYPVKLDRTTGESGLYEVKAQQVLLKLRTVSSRTWSSISPPGSAKAGAIGQVRPAWR
jgi:hypothetical protein